MQEPPIFLHGLVDGQLTPEEQQEAQRQLKAQPELNHELQWAQTGKELLRTRCRSEFDRAAWNKCVQRLDAIDKTRSTERFVTRHAWALSAACLAIIIIGATANRISPNRTLSATQVATFLAPWSGGQGESRGTNLEAAQSLDLSGYQIIREDRAMLDQHPVLRLSLRDQLGGLVLVGVQGTHQLPGVEQAAAINGFRTGQVNGVPCVSWHMRGQTFLLAGNRPDRELLELAGRMIR